MAKYSSTCRVLIVDDEPLIRWALAETLGEQGCEVAEAGDAHGALQAVCDSGAPFDVVVLDFRLPDSRDLALLSHLRSLLPAAKIILMTAFGTPEITEGALNRGAYQVVSKPFEVAALAALVSRAHASQTP
jgi:two-component system, NtrC family, nitrogen regulation response regulator GlnG